MKRCNERKNRITASVICALCVVIVGAGTMGCALNDQISEPHGGIGTASANAGTDSEPPRTGVTSRKQTVTTKPQTTQPQIEYAEPWLEDLPIYVIESGIVWYGGGYTFGDQAKWCNKWLEDALYWAIRDAESEETELKYAVLVGLHPDEQYEYKGKTLKEYESDAFNERVAPSILGELLKEGEYLKYGELIYTTGAPDGELWAKEYYEQKIVYYGEELLAKYIVDGELLRDKLEADMAEDVPTVAKDALREARIAYLDEKFQFMQEYLTGLDIENAIFTREESDFVPKYMIIFVTREQFAGLSCEELGITDEYALSFSLVAKEKYISESAGDV